MIVKPRINLVVFFTDMIELNHWFSLGTLRRETAIYRRLQAYNVHTTFVTYGGLADFRIAREHYQLSVRPNYLGLKRARYRRWLHLLHAPTLAQADIIKTNQIPGSDVAVKSAKFWKKPLILRFGYMHSLFTEQSYGVDSQVTQDAYALEADVFQQADAIVGTTARMKAEIEGRFSNLSVNVIPNYVETDHFKPIPSEKKVDLTFVGRLEKQKNLSALLEAIAPLDVTCRIIGTGSLRDELYEKFGDLNGRLSYLGQVTHEELPRILNETSVFIMPSLYEGHPKSVIEAMSCGLPVIGTNVNGTREVIEHGVSGYLCEATTAESLAKAIVTVLESPTLQAELGKNARQSTIESYALDNIVDQEYELICKTIGI